MYATVQQVRELLKGDVLTAIIGNQHISNAEEREQLLTPIIEQAIADADAEIDGYLAKKYPVPIASVPAVITKYSKDIAVYNLVSRIGIGDEADRENNYLARYNHAIKFLQGVVAGTVALGIDSPTQQASTGFQMSSNNRIFSRDDLRGM